MTAAVLDLDALRVPAGAPSWRAWSLGLTELSDDGLRALRGILDDGERDRAGRFLPPERRLQHVAAHGLKRLVLAAVTGERPAALRFGTGPFGKPFLRGAAGLDFSLSHCEGRVGIAVSTAGRIGFDLERSTRVVDGRVAQGFFSAAEKARLRLLSAEDQVRDRLRLWVLKEAVAKASGLGVARGFDGFDVALDPPGIDVRGPGSDRSRWRLWQGPLGGSHVAALAAEADDIAPASTVNDMAVPCPASA